MSPRTLRHWKPDCQVVTRDVATGPDQPRRARATLEPSAGIERQCGLFEQFAIVGGGRSPRAIVRALIAFLCAAFGRAEGRPSRPLTRCSHFAFRKGFRLFDGSRRGTYNCYVGFQVTGLEDDTGGRAVGCSSGSAPMRGPDDRRGQEMWGNGRSHGVTRLSALAADGGDVLEQDPEPPTETARTTLGPDFNLRVTRAVGASSVGPA